MTGGGENAKQRTTAPLAAITPRSAAVDATAVSAKEAGVEEGEEGEEGGSSASTPGAGGGGGIGEEDRGIAPGTMRRVRRRATPPPREWPVTTRAGASSPATAAPPESEPASPSCREARSRVNASLTEAAASAARETAARAIPSCATAMAPPASPSEPANGNGNGIEEATRSVSASASEAVPRTASMTCQKGQHLIAPSPSPLSGLRGSRSNDRSPSSDSRCARD